LTANPTAPFEGANDSRVRTYLIYVVLDTSESMRRPRRGEAQHGAPQQHFIRLIPQMLSELSSHPVTNSLASVSVLAFNDEPEILRPMTALNQPAMISKPRLGYGTDYAAVLKFLVTQHRKDVQQVKLSRLRDDYGVDVAKPWIFFITDGRPFADDANQDESAWMPHRDKLAGDAIGARIAAIGLPGADRDVLWKLATGNDHGTRNAFISNRSTNARELSESVVTAIQSSITTSASVGLLTIRTPIGMERIEGPRHG
jgi:uncharacterized protein YegL